MTQGEFTKNHGHFSLDEFCITGEIPPADVAAMIMKHHIDVMNPVRDALGEAVFVSNNSGYRPKAWELAHGREGTSQHTYEDEHGHRTKGATDWTARHTGKLLDLMMAMTPYTRICWYPSKNFIHADYKPTPDGKRHLYNADSEGAKWRFIRHI